MNEELKIIVKAVTDEAKKNLADVKKELNGISDTSTKAGANVDKAMKGIGKGVAIAVTAIAALGTAMVAATKKSMEFQKSYNRLITAFQSSGSTIAQAAETYKNLYRFMGESDTATEASNLLVKLTNDEKKLAEWTTILQGVYAEFPDSIPIESLAEAVNETAKVGKVTGALADALNWAGVSEDAMNARLAQTNSYTEREALLRNTLNSLYGTSALLYERNAQATLLYNESQARLDMALAEATKYVVPLMTELNNLAVILLQVLKPAFETISAAIIVFVQWITAAIQYVGAFFGLFGDEGKKATQDVSSTMEQIKINVSGLNSGVSSLGGSLNNAAAAAKELKRQTMGFDELNIVSSQTSASSGGASGGSIPSIGGGGGGSSISIPSLGGGDGFDVPGLEEFEEKIGSVKEKLKVAVPLVGAIGLGVGAWKIGSFAYDIYEMIDDVKYLNKAYDDLQFDFEISDADMADTQISKDLDKANKKLDGVKQKAKTAGATILSVVGAAVAIDGIVKAWTEGVDWGNFLEILAGLGMLVGAAALAFGGWGAAIASCISGIVMVVVGIKDFITNGYSLKNALMILIGAMLTGFVGIGPLIIGAIAILFKELWDRCEGFRNFWIGLWENIKGAALAVASAVKTAWDAVVKFFTETIPNAFKTVINWFRENVCEPIKNFYMKWIHPVVSKLLEMAAKVVEIIGALFVGLWNLLNEKVITPIKDGFKIALEFVQQKWEAAKTFINDKFITPVKNFCSTLWSGIKEIFKPVADFFGEKFQAAYNKVKEKLGKLKTFFTDLWKQIKDTAKDLGVKIGNAISDAVKGAINKVIGLIESRINKAIGLINGAVDMINKLPGVKVDKISKLEMPRLATGGIVTASTIANIGERGREAVLPLENNTGWMDVLADRIASRNGSPSKIVLMLDGKELGWANINSINGITRQTGALQLQLV